MDKKKIHAGCGIGLALLFAIVPAQAFAQVDSLGSAANAAFGELQGILDLFSALCYVLGAIFGVKAALHLKEHTSNPQQVKLSKPIVTMLMCTMLMTMPSVFSTLGETLSFTSGGHALEGLQGANGGSPGQAQGLDGMAKAFASNVPAMMKLVSWGAIIAGAFTILRAILLLPQLEQGRVEGGKIIWLFITGIILWSLLPAITAAMGSIGGGSTDTTNVFNAKYSQSQGGGFDGVIASVLLFVQFLGLTAFIRGTLILKALGEHKDGALGRAMTHIFGGAAAMNIGWTIKLLATSIGASSTICGISQNLC